MYKLIYQTQPIFMCPNGCTEKLLSLLIIVSTWDVYLWLLPLSRAHCIAFAVILTSVTEINVISIGLAPYL